MSPGHRGRVRRTAKRCKPWMHGISPDGRHLAAARVPAAFALRLARRVNVLSSRAAALARSALPIVRFQQETRMNIRKTALCIVAAGLGMSTSAFAAPIERALVTKFKTNSAAVFASAEVGGVQYSLTAQNYDGNHQVRGGLFLQESGLVLRVDLQNLFVLKLRFVVAFETRINARKVRAVIEVGGVLVDSLLRKLFGAVEIAEAQIHFA